LGHNTDSVHDIPSRRPHQIRGLGLWRSRPSLLRNVPVRGLAWNLLWQYAIRHPGILASSVSDAEIRTTTRQFLFGPMLYVVAFIAAFFSGIASLAIILVVLAMFAFFAATTRIEGRSVESV